MADGSRLRLAYLGPRGTFAEEAALLYRAEAQLVPFPSIAAVGTAVATGMAEQGVVPIENSLEGSVSATLDLLIHEGGLSIATTGEGASGSLDLCLGGDQSGLVIRHELVLPVDHCLMVRPGTDPAQIRVLYSHPQALAQCQRFIERCFPKADAMAALSTAAAVEEVMASAKPAGAIGTRRAAELYGAEILAGGIQDDSPNETRFVVLAGRDHARTGSDRTSLCFSIADDRPGALVAVLREFAERRINLSKIESRPSRESLGRYIFLVDLEGHREDEVVRDAIAAIRPGVSLLKLFGSYPRHG